MTTFSRMREAARRVPHDDQWLGPPSGHDVLKAMRDIAHAEMLDRAHRRIWTRFVRATRRAMKARDDNNSRWDWPPGRE